MAEKGVDRNTIKWWYGICGVGFVGILWLLTFASFVWGDYFHWIDVGDRGTFGDMFGGLNALFSGLAFVGIIFTIYMQRKEFELQREELGLTRETLESQRKELEVQNKTLKLQQFENTFFSMLRVHNDNVNSIDLVKSDSTRTKGRDCFRVLYRRLKNGYLPIKLKETRQYKP